MRRMRDLDPREKAILVPLVVLTIVFGVWPTPVLKVTDASVNALVSDIAQTVPQQTTPAVDTADFIRATGSASDAVRAGLVAAGMAPAEGAEETHGEGGADAAGEDEDAAGGEAEGGSAGGAGEAPAADPDAQGN